VAACLGSIYLHYLSMALVIGLVFYVVYDCKFGTGRHNAAKERVYG
jgi:hypothetical protein